MKWMFTFYAVSLLSISIAFAQTTPFEKECRLAGGGGFANGFDNASGGPEIWLQMSYRLSKNFSIGTEFENMYYRRPDNFQLVSKLEEVRKIYDNYISFIIKYHLPVPSKFQLNAVCGWTYRIQQENQFFYENAFSNYLMQRQSTFSNYAIPFIAEVSYSLRKVFQVGVRGKYNLNGNGSGDTYSTGLLVGMKL